MTRTVLRSAGSVLLSLIVALLLVVAIEGASAVLHPFPDGFVASPESMAGHVANYPAWVLFLLGGVGWSLTVLVSCYLATRFGTRRHPAHGMTVGALLLAAAAFNIAMLPYPIWFVLLDVLLLPAGMVIGIRMARTGELRSTA